VGRFVDRHVKGALRGVYRGVLELQLLGSLIDEATEGLRVGDGQDFGLTGADHAVL
jgi:hypothetical protein